MDKTDTYSLLHYALGGGLGHIVRQLAIANSIQKQTAGKSKSTIVTTSEFAPLVAQLVTHQDHDHIQFELLPPNCSPTESEHLLSKLINSKPICLIVDVFPRGLGGELVNCFVQQPNLTRVLVARNLPSGYLHQFQVESFVRNNYQRVFRIEPEAPFENLPQSQLTCPVIFQAATTSPTPATTQDGERRVLVIGSGTHAECQELRRLADDLNSIARSNIADDTSQPCKFYFHGPTLAGNGRFYWPPASQLAGFDLIIGNAGYNLFWETRLTRVPAILFARPRKYDNQRIRSEFNWPMPAIEIFDLVKSKLGKASENTPPTLDRNSIDELTASVLGLMKSPN